LAKKTIWPIVAFAAVSAIFFVVTLNLLVEHFNRGNEFAPYSSFRTDPLGMKIFHDALKKHPGLTVERFLSSIENLPDGKDKTLFICGADQSPDAPKTINALESFAKKGGRIVITFRPEQATEKTDKEIERNKDKDGSKNNGEESKKDNPASKADNADIDGSKEQNTNKDAPPTEHNKTEPSSNPTRPPWFDEYVSIEKPWGFRYAIVEEPPPSLDEDAQPFSRKVEKVPENPNAPFAVSASLPGSLTWRSALFFNDLAREWRVIYQWRMEQNLAPYPVVIERTFGEGSVVLCSDAFPLSNEAMSKDRQAEFLSWLTGASTTVLFEESHLGNMLQANTMSLAWKYHLHGVVASLIILALLYIWKNVGSLTPKKDLIEEDLRVAKDHAAALANLLRRSVPRKRLLEICVQEWRKSGTPRFRAGGVNSADKKILERIQGVVEEQRDQSSSSVIAGYAAIREILSERAHNRER
jgi:hypothetical protein